MGAAAGCLLLVPFLTCFGGPNTVIAAACCSRPPPLCGSTSRTASRGAHGWRGSGARLVLVVINLNAKAI